MYNAKFISAVTGTSKNTGADWYRLDLVAQTVDGGNTNQTNFVSSRVYRDALGLAPFDDVVISVGVSSSGHFEIAGIKKRVGVGGEPK